MSTLDQPNTPSPNWSSWRRTNLYDAPSAPSSLFDLRTQSEVLARLLVEPDLLQKSFGDLTVADFGGKVHQSLFRTFLKLAEEGKDFDIVTVAEAWGAEKEVGDPIAYLSDLLNTELTDYPSVKLRLRVEKLHSLSHLRRLRFLGENLQRHAESAQSDPHALIERVASGIEALRAGYDLNGDLLPYAPRNLTRRPDLVTLSSVEAKPVPWLWQPYLPYGMITLLSGEPGAGKTYLALSFAAALTVGKIPFTGESIQPLDVVYLSKENSIEYSVRPRFDLLQGDASRCHMLQGAVTGEGPKARRDGVRLTDIPLLESALKQTKARFLVVDPIQSYLGGEVDMHRSNETRPILDALGSLVEKYEVCLLILRHFAKSTVGSALSRGLGSIDITGAARTELQAGACDGRNVLVHAKSNIGPKGKSMGYEIVGEGFRWTGEMDLTADDLAAGSIGNAEDRDAVSEAVEYLSSSLLEGAKLATECVAELKACGVSERTIRRAKTKLGVKSRKRWGAKHGPHEWYLDAEAATNAIRE